MAYIPRPDGLFDIPLPNGKVITTAAPESMLQAGGVPLYQMPAPEMPEDRLALGEGGAPVMSDAGATMSEPEASDVPTGPMMSVMPPETGGAPMVGGVPSGAGAPGFAPHPPLAEPEKRTVLPALARSLTQTPPGMGMAPVAPEEAARQAQADVGEKAAESAGYLPPEEEEKETKRVNIEPAASGAPGPQRARYVNSPARDVRARWTVQRGQGIPTEDLEAVEQAGEQGDVAIQNQATERWGAIEPLLLERERRNQQDMEALESRRAQRAEIDRKLADQEREIDAREQELSSVQNPTAEKYWKQKGIIGRLLAAISITAGGVVQGAKGGQNPGLVLVNNAVNQWIDDQVRDYNRKKGAVSAAKNAYAEALDRYGTPEAAQAAMRLEANTLADNALKTALTRVQEYGALEGAQQVIADREQQRAQMMLQLKALNRDSVTEQWVHVPARSVQVGGITEDSDVRKRRVRLADGTWGWVRGLKAGEADEVQGQVDAYGQLQAITRRMGDIISSVRVPGTVERRQLDALFQTAAKLNEQYYKMGVLREGDYQRAKTQFGDPDAFFKLNPKAGIEEVSNIYRQGYSTVVGNRVSRDPDGWVPVYEVTETNTDLGVRNE